MMLAECLREFISACFTGVWIESHEHPDALAEIAGLCRQENWQLATWDIERGLSMAREAGADTAGGQDPLAAIRSLAAMASADGAGILVLENFHRFLQSAEFVQALAQQITAGKQIRGVEPQALRDSTDLRQRVATQLSGVQSALDGLLVDRPRRNILRRSAK